MSKINTAPLGGTRDFLPLAVLQRKYVVDVIERVYQRHGFEPLETPVMERLETLLGKYGEEGDQLIFRVLKRGESLQAALRNGAGENELSDSGLRFDLTVPLARVVAAYRQQLPKVFKRYQIQPVYRADRPAKGRFREFFQCDVDIVGTTSQVAEAEVIGAVATVLHELGFKGREDFTVRLNHRGILRGLMAVAGVPEALEGVTLVAIDKLDKIGMDGVRAELHNRGVGEQATAALLDAMATLPESTEARLSWLGELLASSAAGSAGVADLQRVLAYTTHGPAAGHLAVDPYLARGLSYYTGPIFEIAFAGLGVSGGGGGRYDNLVGMFSGTDIPAVGFSLGLERILLVMEERGMFPARLVGQPDVLITLFDESTAAASFSLAEHLRAAGLRVDLYTDFDRYGKQFQYAEKRQIRYALLVGAREQQAGLVVARDLKEGSQEEVPRDDIVGWLHQRL